MEEPLFSSFVLFLFSTHLFPLCCPIEGPTDRKDKEEGAKRETGGPEGANGPRRWEKEQ